ncbi:MAG: nuclear transport factor 2 family protein [Colwellia sp.]|nr:nuclear transport factor 2 family protein [Colwellia sp.]
MKVYSFIFTLCLFSIHLFANDNVTKNEIGNVLNTFHQAAADANQVLYFSLLDEQAIFLGTDGSERWNKNEFSAFVTPYFSKGQGWLYQPSQRNITIIPPSHSNEQLAFFDELLENNNYGQCRGSGVLRLTSSGWKILQYNLSIPVPNGIASEIVEQIQNYQQNSSSNN